MRLVKFHTFHDVSPFLTFDKVLQLSPLCSLVNLRVFSQPATAGRLLWEMSLIPNKNTKG